MSDQPIVADACTDMTPEPTPEKPARELKESKFFPKWMERFKDDPEALEMMMDMPPIGSACDPEPTSDPASRKDEALAILDAAIAVAFHAGLPSLAIANQITRTRAAVFASIAGQCPGQNLQCPEVEAELAKGYGEAVVKIIGLCSDAIFAGDGA